MNDVREAVEKLINGLDPDLTVYWRLQPDYLDHLPAVALSVGGGAVGYIDRTDRLVVEVYGSADADAQSASDVGNMILQAIVNKPHYVEGVGQLDTVDCSVVPHDVPWADPNVELNQAEYRVTYRLGQ